MIKDFLQSITAIRFFAIIFLLLIIGSFFFVLVYVIRMKKKDLKKYSRLPLDDSDDPETMRIHVSRKNDKSGE